MIRRFNKIKGLLALALGSAILSACQTTPSRVAEPSLTPAPPAVQAARIAPGPLIGSVAVSDIQLEHPAARLYFSETAVRDMLSQHSLRSERFRVVDWSRLNDTLRRIRIDLSDLETSAAARQQTKALLLNDFFLTGSITGFGERMEFNPSRYSKERTQTAQAQVDLFIKDALSNEVISSGHGEGQRSRLTGVSAAFGPAGGSDSTLAIQALDDAMGAAMAQLVDELDQKGIVAGLSPDTRPVTQAGAPAAWRGESFLFIFSEQERGVKSPGAGPPVIDVSEVEQYMAKQFNLAGAKVLTADDVLGRAYHLRGGADILLTEYLTERDIEELESLFQARKGLGRYAVKVGKAARADYVVSGTVEYEISQAEIAPGVTAPLASIAITAKTMRTRDGKTLNVATERTSFVSVIGNTGSAARSGAVEKATRRLADTIHHALVKRRE